MALTALTNIAHGQADGERVEIPQGEKIPSGVFDKKTLQNLVDSGAVGEPPAAPSEVAATAEENEALKERVEALEAELAAAKAPKK